MPEIPRSRAWVANGQHHQGRSSGMQQKQHRSSGDANVIGGNQHRNGREITDHNLIDGPPTGFGQDGGGTQYLSHPDSLYQASVSANPFSISVPAVKPNSRSARSPEHIQYRHRASVTLSIE